MKYILVLSTLLFWSLQFGSKDDSIAIARGLHVSSREPQLMSVKLAGPHWGDPKKDHCTGPGVRQYSAILWGLSLVNFNQEWEKACVNMPNEINNQSFEKPTRCKNTGLNMWGEFEVEDSTCDAYWEIPFQTNDCTAIGVREYSSQLLGAGVAANWEAACVTTGATIQGQVFARPARCEKPIAGAFGMWGEFDVLDDSCKPKWNPFKADKCVALGVRQYSAQINVPNGLSWEVACNTTGATIQGQMFEKPDRCKNMGLAGMWGEFDVKDDSCKPNWNPFKEDHCVELDKRQNSAQLLVPDGLSWEVACDTTGATIQGQMFEKLDRCKNVGLAGMWGEFDVADTSCRPRWGEFSRDHCTGIRTRQYSAILWEIPKTLSWERVCSLTEAKIAGQYFSRPSRCVNFTGLNEWGEFDVSDYTCLVGYPLRQLFRLSWQTLAAVGLVLLVVVGLVVSGSKFLFYKKILNAIHKDKG